ncbi:MAG: YbgC/FadM family acyl-CoA thioesterase [Candidatus Omnitrophica bacterium]|jgi:acyl-CoA thioester hydrolase|nr:YbgC/FadM family acyl-CoA thioesterase [Candidatus Omnitrophota bacterium]
MKPITKKIYYHDTDCGGVVYYANYLKYFEEGRTEFFSNKGINIAKLSDNNIWFVVRKVEINYRSPARYADELLVFTTVAKVKNVSLDFEQQIKRGEQLLVSAITQLVCVDSKFGPRVIPQEVIEKLGHAL